jgi:hypothetical protein
VESRVLEGIANHLGHPDLIAAYVREHHRQLEERRSTQNERERALRRSLGEVLREGRRLVDAIAKGTSPRMVNERLKRSARN